MNNIKRYDRRKLGASKVKSKISSLSRFENQDKSAYYTILENAMRDWLNLSQFRDRANRAIRYKDGNQWGDVIVDPDNPGRFITEEAYIKRQGKVPLIQNIIFSITRNILGQYRSNSDKPVVLIRDPQSTDQESVFTDILQSVGVANQLSELDAQNFSGFNDSGMLLQRVSYRYLKEYDRGDVYVENISHDRIFFNSDVKDIRLNDLYRIGVIHDLSLDELLSQFCNNKSEEEWLCNRFRAETAREITKGLSGKENFDFLVPAGRERIRVFECWYLKTVWKTYIINDPATGSEGITNLTKQQIEAINKQRIDEVLQWNIQNPEQQIPEDEIAIIEYELKLEPEWNVVYLLSDATCLYEAKTPYEHQEHPFVLRLNMGLNGNVYGITHQLIDQQRMINRAVMLWDFTMSAGAKGLLMIPEDCLGNMNINQIADEWVRFNGVVTYKPSKYGAAPQQITSNSVPVGVNEMLQLQLKLMQDISGVHGAIQGRTPSSGTSGTLYQQETINASINSTDVMKIASAFKEVRDRKILKTAMQFYAGKRRILTENGIITIDPEKIRDIDFDITIIQNTDTPAYRTLVEERLTQMVMSGLIPPEVYFQNSSDPTIKKVYETIKQMAENNTQNIPQEIQQAASQGDPQAMQMLQQAVNPQTNLQMS